MKDYCEVTLYDPATGEIRGYVSGHPEQVARNVPGHLKAVDGSHDYRFKKVDLATGGVVEHRAPRPGQDHDWHEGIGWVKKTEEKEHG